MGHNPLTSTLDTPPVRLGVEMSFDETGRTIENNRNATRYNIRAT